MAERIIDATQHHEQQVPQTGVPLIERIAKMATACGVRSDEASALAWEFVKIHRLGSYPAGYFELKAAADAAVPLNGPAALAH